MFLSEAVESASAHSPLMNRKPSSVGIAELEPHQPASSVHWGPGPRVVYVMHGFGRRMDLGIVGRTSGSLHSRVGEKSNTMANAHMWGLAREERAA
jgi:hypothetical protein